MNVLNLNEVCPGKNKFVLAKINGNKEHNQKRLLLGHYFKLASQSFAS